jgi:iron complex transport system ATP-binding protein
LRKAGIRYGTARILSDITLAFEASGLTAVVGPNGAGKSTLLSILAGLRGGYTGECLYRGVEVRDWKRRAFAREVSYVPQSLQLEFPFTAEQVVFMGRTPFCDGLFESPEDAVEVDRAMRITDTLAFRHRDFGTLSGGERQRVVLAGALAQQPKTLLLDEPAAFLDLRHQVEIYRLLARLSADGLLAVVVTHDINLAAAFAGRVVMLAEGRVVADGPPHSTLTRQSIADVFGLHVELHEGRGGRPWILYGG